ncbi:2,5-dichloro-2,5-cyclohexadiene-1,4-diol dehydrogenase [Nocardia gamkensis]|uniref:SDR family NAD(P)-dependent oxidoreductase n=1 Tax=Nocardia gamkensis TaxID=352869 RepID=A0A7X6L172_9NOCA|nr:SDR family NAD(P)-dependent oxidoreductase [Nocardia gamkensis]NQE68963.1 2,5-dichloro-2,5-cyclohexadiene-1,4-diol dehydrogenase [Nocardia gamkensis]
MNRTAIVTGGGSGIGAALTRALVAAGADVRCADIHSAAARTVVSALEGPGKAVAVALDVTDAAAVRAVVDDVVARDEPWVVTPRRTRLGWYISRVAPRAMQRRLNGYVHRQVVADRVDS